VNSKLLGSVAVVVVAGGYLGYEEYGKRQAAKKAAADTAAAAARRTPPSTAASGSAGDAPRPADPRSADAPETYREPTWLDLPDLKGMTEAEADAAMRKAGFLAPNLEVMPANFACSYDDDRQMLPQGQICDQKPPPGARLSSKRGGVKIVIERDTYEHGGVGHQEWHRMPDLLGKPVAEARSILAAQGFTTDEFTVEVVQVQSCQRDVICETAPVAGLRKTTSYPGKLIVGK